MARKSVGRFKQGAESDRRQTDRQTTLEKLVAIGDIACARATSPNNGNLNQKTKCIHFHV